MNARHHPSYGFTDYNVTTRPITQSEYEFLGQGMMRLRPVLMFFSIITIAFAVVNVIIQHDAICIATAIVGLVCMIVTIVFYMQRRVINVILKDGMLTDVTGVPARVSRGGWSIGPISVPSPSAEFNSRIQEGRVVTLTCVPNLSFAGAVDGVPLKRPVMIRAPQDLAPTVSTQQYASPAPAQQTFYQQPTAPPPPPAQQPPHQQQSSLAPPIQPGPGYIPPRPPPE